MLKCDVLDVIMEEHVVMYGAQRPQASPCRVGSAQPADEVDSAYLFAKIVPCQLVQTPSRTQAHATLCIKCLRGLLLSCWTNLD